jgi:hypothetical protein
MALTYRPNDEVLAELENLKKIYILKQISIWRSKLTPRTIFV